MDRNLEKGQFQIGNLVMGEWTPFSVEDLMVNGYELNVQDYQNSGSSELGFGSDSKKPTTIQMTINVRVNRLLPNIAALVNDSRPLDFSNDRQIDDLQSEWRADETLGEWGAVKPLIFRGGDGIVRQFMGRPGKLSYKLHKINGGDYYICTAEYRRSDTYGWGNVEYFVDAAPEEPFTVLGTNGNASGHCRFVIFGPVDHPVINFGDKQFELDFNIVEGDAVEISSYSWQRRIVNLEGYSLASYLIADRPYLEEIILPFDASTVISWTGTDPGEDARLVFFWRNCYQMLK